MEPNKQHNADDRRRIVVRTPYMRNRPDGSAQAAQWGRLCRSSIAVRSPMVALSACPGRREVVVWASYWRRGRSGNAIGLTKVALRAPCERSTVPIALSLRSVFLISDDHTAIWWILQVAMVAAWSPSCVTGALDTQSTKYTWPVNMSFTAINRTVAVETETQLSGPGSVSIT